MLDPGCLRLQHLGQHGGHRRRNRSDQSFGRDRRRGWLGPVAAHRRGASAADLPAAGADHSFRHRSVDGPGQASCSWWKSRRISRRTFAPSARPALQINVDATAVAQAGNGASSLRNAIATEIQRFISGQSGLEWRADQSRGARRFQPEPEDFVVLGDDPGHQPDHPPNRHSHRRGADPRARAGHGRAPSRHAGRAVGDHARQDDRQRSCHPGRSDAVAAIRRPLVDRLADQRVFASVPASARRSMRLSWRRSESCSARSRQPWGNSACSPCPC